MQHSAHVLRSADGLRCARKVFSAILDIRKFYDQIFETNDAVGVGNNVGEVRCRPHHTVNGHLPANDVLRAQIQEQSESAHAMAIFYALCVVWQVNVHQPLLLSTVVLHEGQAHASCKAGVLDLHFSIAGKG